jgi:predicted nucleic acid-binding protein
MTDSLYLVDTSVWIEVLPSNRPATPLRERIDGLLAADMVATTGVVRLELLGRARGEAEFRKLGELLSALHQLEIAEERWEEAAQLAFGLRRKGISVPFTDLLISAVTAHNGAILLHRDRHFDVVAGHTPLVVESHVQAVR